MPPTTPTVDEVRGVVGLAVLAPSVHNSQPWRFRWDGAALEVVEDASRALPAIDQSGRERVLSCGAALLHAELALAELGWATRTTELPGDDVLARVEVTGRREATPRQHLLAAAIARRTTDRDPYASRPVPQTAVEVLRSEAEVEGGWLRHVTPLDDEVALEVLLARADAEQRRDPAYLAELRAWRTVAGPTGVPDAGLPTVTAGDRASSLALRDFDAGRATGGAPTGDRQPAAEHPAVVVLGTPGDSRADWLQAGRVTARVLLAATVEGLAAQPLTAVLEVPRTRALLRRALGAVGQPQMVLRIGYGTRGPASRRLPVEGILQVSHP